MVSTTVIEGKTCCQLTKRRFWRKNFGVSLQSDCPHGPFLGPPVLPYRFFFGGERDYRKTIGYPYSILSAGGPSFYRTLFHSLSLSTATPHRPGVPADVPGAFVHPPSLGFLAGLEWKRARLGAETGRPETFGTPLSPPRRKAKESLTWRHVRAFPIVCEAGFREPF